MHGFSLCSTQTFCVIMDIKWALAYKGTVPQLFSTVRDVHTVCLLSCMLGMIWGKSSVFPGRESPAWTRQQVYSSGLLTWIQLAEALSWFRLGQS